MPDLSTDVAALRADCPTCQTSYTYLRLGLGGAVMAQQSTVACPVCQVPFDTIVEVAESVVAAPVWRIWDRTPTVTRVLVTRSIRRPL